MGTPLRPTTTGAELKYLHSPGVLDLEGWSPDNPDHFGLAVQAIIGPAEEGGAEAFGVRVCTPSWFGERLLPDRPVNGEHTLLMVRWDCCALVGFTEQYVGRCEGRDWREIARQLSRLGRSDSGGCRPPSRFGNARQG